APPHGPRHVGGGRRSREGVPHWRSGGRSVLRRIARRPIGAMAAPAGKAHSRPRQERWNRGAAAISAVRGPHRRRRIRAGRAVIRGGAETRRRMRGAGHRIAPRRGGDGTGMTDASPLPSFPHHNLDSSENMMSHCSSARGHGRLDKISSSSYSADRTRPGDPMATSLWRNWSGTETAEPVRTVKPGNTSEVVAAVRAAADERLRVKAAGSGHSFSGVGVPEGVLVDMSDLDGVTRVVTGTNVVTGEGGLLLWRLNRVLHAHGLALENMGEIGRQTLSGALSPGTHGTGDRYRGLAWQ